MDDTVAEFLAMDAERRRDCRVGGRRCHPNPLKARTTRVALRRTSKQRSRLCGNTRT